MNLFFSSWSIWVILVFVYEFWVLAVLGVGWSMGKHRGHRRRQPRNHNHHHQHENGRKVPPRRDPRVACGCRPCIVASSIFRRMGRCMFVTCYPVIQCFGCDDHRHRRHHHKHFFWKSDQLFQRYVLVILKLLLICPLRSKFHAGGLLSLYSVHFLFTPGHQGIVRRMFRWKTKLWEYVYPYLISLSFECQCNMVLLFLEFA